MVRSEQIKSMEGENMLVKYSPGLLSPLFEDFLRSAETAQETDLIPRCDIVERENDYVVYAEIPGVAKDNMKVEFQNHLLTISGRKHPVERKENERYYRAERLYGTFSRSFRLGDEINTSKISAHYENGVLEVILPKNEKVLPRMVDIKVS